ncbi:beta-fimbriae major subunit [Yersinia rohdei]|uniref:Beta-fimbriae major subunit n=2 Tax=Yersinia rohdei TaxID=29485 RepID=A0A0U1HR19_YERRO|nr:beta-fimbriae major subunit [Yersinia rohdei]CNJ07969.1 beta-fimbriae major subunit [Yersinia rohdei]CQI88878.1 beta-fimbriae major subunit [Yersinia rohdei]CQJ52897.1 beta-fimbriae major subunit [Yersinia rohdei]
MVEARLEYKMKKQLTVLAFLILCATAAHAAPPTAELKVKGEIGVPACNINAPDNGVYNFGNISSTQIKSGTTTTGLPKMSKSWTIICDASTYLNVTPIDNRAATASSTETKARFGLGSINGNGKIGFYWVALSNAKVDNQPSNLYYTSTNAFTSVGTSANLWSGSITGWASAANTQTAGKVFSADFEVEPVLAGVTDMKGTITEDIKIDGSLTMNFAFGI